MGFSNGRKVLLISLLLVATAAFTFLSVASASSEPHKHRKILLEEDEEEGEAVVVPTKKKTTTSTTISSSSSSSKNKTKLLKPSSSTPSSASDSTDTKPLKSSSTSTTSTKNLTKLIKPISTSLKNKTKSSFLESKGDLSKIKNKLNSTTSKIKIVKPTSDITTTSKIKIVKPTSDISSIKSATKLKKLNTTSDPAKPSSITSTKKPTDPIKSKTAKPKTDEVNIKGNKKISISSSKTLSSPSWLYNSDEDDDLVSEFRDMPTKFQKAILPDLQRISSSSKNYFTQANKEFTKNFKPYVGNKYASSAASAISCAFIIIPFLLVSLLFNRIKAFFSIQKLLIFIQVYLSIYFMILCMSSLITGLEPLKFFYASSRSTYVGLQVLQTLGYVLYLLLLLMYLILVFSTESGLGSKFLGLAQTFVGFAVGLHYYMTVFHRVVLHQPPKTNWKVHAVYATCFLVICLLAGADRRKKEYLTEGGEEGKKS